MSTHTDSHATTTPAPDVVAVDYGAMNREILAEKLASAWLGCRVTLDGQPGATADWLRVVDVAITELQGTP